ncbi:MAG: hypothetical protein L6265_08765 [Thermoplasmatales archaeon]|nr:hypothetical protein [Candidatus Thermoplasmatota archaeon]MCG2826666.1 hypothetical protein [Thermoplasmatales archaeon]
MSNLDTTFDWTIRAVPASIETMLDYGMMRDWDEATRAWEREHREAQISPVSAN